MTNTIIFEQFFRTSSIMSKTLMNSESINNPTISRKVLQWRTLWLCFSCRVMYKSWHHNLVWEETLTVREWCICQMIFLYNQKGMQLHMETTPKLPDPMSIYVTVITINSLSLSGDSRSIMLLGWKKEHPVRQKFICCSLSELRLYFPLSKPALKSFESPINIVTLLTLKSF